MEAQDTNMRDYQTLKQYCDLLEEAAIARDRRICISVMDMHGNVVLMHRMPGCPVISPGLAERKAFTSLAMRVESAALVPLVQPGQPLFSLPAVAGLVAGGGGTFVEFDDGVAYGVGVSGGATGEEDDEMLKAAQAKLATGTWAGQHQD